MNAQFRGLFIILGAALVVATFTFPQWFPLINRASQQVAGEVFASLDPVLVPTFQALPIEQQNAYRAVADVDVNAALTMAGLALSPVTPVPEEEQGFPDMTGPVVVGTGQFVRVDPIRYGSGKVTIYEQADGMKMLRLEDFSMVNGPDLHVVLSASTEPTTWVALTLFNRDIDLGSLIGAEGNQNYALPAEIELVNYGSVAIVSRSLNMVYTYAPLRITLR